MVMDRERFDALARLLATTGSRRSALSALLGAALLGKTPEVSADRQHGHGRGQRQGKGKRKAGGQGQDSRPHRAQVESGQNTPAGSSDGDGHQGGGAHHNGKQTDNKPRRGTGNDHDRRDDANAQAAPTRCFTGSPCNPGPGARLQECDFTGSDALKNVNCAGCIARGISLIGADASGANFRGANLSNACLVGADLTDATFNAATNLGGAIFCRTTMPNGRVNNSGCGNSTRCCETCIAIGDVCGPGVGGSCCGGATCQNGRCACPANKPNNCDGVCRQCCNDGNCSGSTPKCCDGVCRPCCASGDCPAQECRTATCTGQGTCRYTDVPDNRPGPLCPAPNVCCDGGCCDAGQVCDTRHGDAVCCTPDPPTTTCEPPGGPPRCGRTLNNCGDLVDCGPCEDIVCNTGSCDDRSHTCEYTPVRDLTQCDPESVTQGVCCDGDCVDGNCCANRNCTGNANTCAGHTCRCGSGAACTFPNISCCGASPGGTCVDTSNDINNCGGCGQRCSRNNVCTGDPPRCCQPPGIFCSYLFGLQRRCCSGDCRPFPFAPIGIGTCH
jgi:hypothetical protein